MTTQETMVAPVPPVALQGSTGLTLLRRICAVLLLILSVGVLYTVGMLQTINAIVGKPAEAIDTGLSIIASPSSAKALSTQLVTQLQKNAGDDTRLAFLQHKDAFIAEVGKVIQDPQVRAMARADLLLAYNAINTGKKTTVDLKPLLTKFTSALHRVDARIPALGKDMKNTTVTIDKKVNALNLVDKLTVAVWVFTIFGVAMAVVTARFLVRNRLRRVIAVSLALLLPTAMLFSVAGLIGNLPQSLNINDHEVEFLATALARHVGGVLLVTALVFLGFSVIVIGAFLFANKRAMVTATATNASPEEGATPHNLRAPASAVDDELGGAVLPAPPSPPPPAGLNG